MFSLKPSDLAFLDEGRTRAQVRHEISATPHAVFAVIADQSTWASWCADCREATWLSLTTGAPGAVRVARFGAATFEERILAWEPGARFAFSVDRCSIPLARRVAEDWRLTPLAAGGTELLWDLVVETPPLARPLWPVARRAAEAMFARTASGLDRYLRR